MVRSLILSLRPGQWTKNLLVFAGLIFGSQLRNTDSVLKAVSAFAVFCALSGVVYLINDIRDREADRLHPKKSKRPIASGALSPGVALAAAGVLCAGALAWAYAINLKFAAIALSYVILQTLYSITLKHLVILDVLTLSGGFVLRAAGGAAAVSVAFSHWLLLLTLLLALFMALSKRRAEIVTLASDAAGHRRILAEYSTYLLDQMISVVTASTLLAYAFYTMSPETVAKFGPGLVYTIPFPLYGIFRYLYLVHQRAGGGNPSETLVTDKPLLLCVALFVGAVILILYGPWAISPKI